MSFYPIVYVRGYAMTPEDVERTFNRPYYGFNVGSTQFRLTSDAKPTMRVFESPVVRLIKDEGYVDSLNRFVDDRNRPIAGSVASAKPRIHWQKTLWVFRYYDAESKLLGEARRGEVEDYAEALATFLDEVKRACGAPRGFKVNLVAHSMGGLICRCYLQNTRLFERPALRDVAPVSINKLFTYGSPHGGITFRRGLGWVEDVRDVLGVHGSDTFGERRMRQFLSLDGGDHPDLRMYKSAREDMGRSRIFCLVGSNYKDYVTWVSKIAVGPGSDGLVAIENAYVKGAPRAYVHLAHSGPFGMVNSEEGYQNLTRFLFGDIRYEASLEPIVVKAQAPNLGEDDQLNYLVVDTNIVVRGLSTFVNVRQEDNHNAIILRMSRPTSHPPYRFPGEHLYTGFLRLSKRMRGDSYMRGAIDIRIKPHYTHDGFIRDSRFEGESFIDKRLHLALKVNRRRELVDVAYSWDRMAADIHTEPRPDGSYLFPLPDGVSNIECAGIRVNLSAWD